MLEKLKNQPARNLKAKTDATPKTDKLFLCENIWHADFCIEMTDEIYFYSLLWRRGPSEKKKN